MPVSRFFENTEYTDDKTEKSIFDLFHPPVSLFASLQSPIANPEMLSTPKFYVRKVQYGSPAFRNCGKLTCICLAIFIIGHGHITPQTPITPSPFLLCRKSSERHISSRPHSNAHKGPKSTIFHPDSLHHLVKTGISPMTLLYLHSLAELPPNLIISSYRVTLYYCLFTLNKQHFFL